MPEGGENASGTVGKVSVAPIQPDSAAGTSSCSCEMAQVVLVIAASIGVIEQDFNFS